MNALSAIFSRYSANKFDPERELEQTTLVELVSAATQAPSAYNLQHSRFLVITDKAAKEQLKALAYHQQKVADASAVFIVLGDLDAWRTMPEIGRRGVSAGLFDQATAEGMSRAVKGSYAENSAFNRDEAIRSASLAAMNLMTAATSMGLVSGPMIGFEAAKVSAAFGLGDRYLPVIMITVGYGAPGNWPKKPRFTAAEVSAFDARPGQAVEFGIQ